MNKLYSLLAVLAVAVLIGAGCAPAEEPTTTNETVEVEETTEAVTDAVEEETVTEEQEVTSETTDTSADTTTTEATTETTEPAQTETTTTVEETTTAETTETSTETTEENTDTAEETTSGYTMAEVATHNSASDCWLVIDNKVYDVTSFVSSHPGGSAILRGCGVDATSMFASHPASADAVKAKYKIGDLAQ